MRRGGGSVSLRLMPHAITLRHVGGPERLEWTEISVPPPGPNEVQLRQMAVGLNFIDVYQRTGLYPVPVPFVPGQEGAGVVTALGDGVTTVRVGDRVAYAGLAGAYATVRNAPVDRLVLVPDGIDDTLAARFCSTPRRGASASWPFPGRGTWARR